MCSTLANMPKPIVSWQIRYLALEWVAFKESVQTDAGFVFLCVQDADCACEALERFQGYVDPSSKSRAGFQIEYASNMEEVSELHIHGA